MSVLSKFFPRKARIRPAGSLALSCSTNETFGFEERQLRQQYKRLKTAYVNMITAASSSRSQPGWHGIRSRFDEDNYNKEYLHSLGEVQARAQDLDVNNPDVRGFHRARVAQILGKGVHFKHVPKDSEVGVSNDQLISITAQVDRIRHLHSRMGGFDASGRGRSEGKQQERAMLTMFVNGSCLVHRVWRTDSRMLLPFSIELIPGTRISTPFSRQGDPLISYGIQYSDEHRTRVVGYHVRRVSKTIGDSFVSDYEWDFLPVEDCVELSLSEMAGLDRALPLSVANVRMLRNRGEFVESAVQSARAQSKFYAVTECAEGDDPFDAAADDADQSADGFSPTGFTTLGDGVEMLYSKAGEKVTWNSAKLPDPEFESFNSVVDSRLSRGFVASKSRFTREVSSSYAGGRMEDQQDDPIIDQYRETFTAAWQRVNEWFLEAVWITGVVKLPTYNLATKAFWGEFRAQFPGKVHLNPVDTANARSIGYMLRTLTPQAACEQDGVTLEGNLELWGQAMQKVKDYEEKYELEPGTLAFLISGKTLSTSAGDDVGAPTPAPEPEPGEPEPSKKPVSPKNRIFVNQAGV